MSAAVLNATEREMLRILNLPAGMSGRDGHLWTHVAEHGRFQAPGPPVPTDRLREDRYCFDNALEEAEEFGLPYVTGFAASSSWPFPFEHAWNLNPDGTVHEVTWKRPGAAYLGIVFDDLEVVREARFAEMSPLLWQLWQLVS